jgi:hypothetical protein
MKAIQTRKVAYVFEWHGIGIMNTILERSNELAKSCGREVIIAVALRV